MPKGKIYIGTNNGLNVLDQNTNQFTTYNRNDTIPSSIPSNLITSLFIDSKKNIWVGTNKGIAIFNEDVGDFETIQLNGQLAIDNLTFWTIVELQGNQIMVGTKNGYLRLNNSTRQFEIINPFEISTTIWSMSPSGKNSLLAGTKHGLYYIKHLTGKYNFSERFFKSPQGK